MSRAAAALCAFCAVVAPTALAVSPDAGQGVLGGGKDIEMTVAPGAEAASRPFVAPCASRGRAHPRLQAPTVRAS